MSGILYVKKKDKTKNWSNVLYRQYKDLKSISGGKVYLHEIDTSSITSYFLEPFKVYKKLRNANIQILYVNHIICAFPLIFILPFLYSKIRILALHESEPVLGFKFLKKYRKMLSIKEWIRYLPIMWIPIYFFDSIFVLNNKQLIYKWIKKDRFKQINFLGINSKINLLHSNSQPKYDIFFPHNPNRIEKGYSYFKDALSLIQDEISGLKILVGGDFSHDEMGKNYSQSDIVILSGYYETYSIVFLEAASYNNKIVVNNNIGIIQNIIKIKGESYLAKKGVFVSDLNKQSLSENIKKALSFPLKDVKTREIISDLGLFEKEVNKTLYQKIIEINK